MTEPLAPSNPRPARTLDAFSGAAFLGQAPGKRKTPPPFSLRLTFEERSRLEAEAGDMPLGAYIRSKLLGGPASPPRRSRGKNPVKDHQALAKVLGLLGQSRLASNLNQLAKAAHTGSLPVTPDTESSLQDACKAIQAIRHDLMTRWWGGSAMILKGNQRGGGTQLARHLLNTQDNEHIEVHELRGFMADDLQSALHEAYAVSRGTRAKQFLFSLSLNPPLAAKVPTEAFERAIETIEIRLGLEGLPRAIVFHEKEGRRHAHAVWSRIDPERMRAINLPHYKLRLRDVAKELYREHGWQMPRGFVDSKERDPATFTHAAWQQAKRAGHDPKALKAMFQECWAASDGGKAFAQALKARGYTLACGDRRGHVAVDYRGEIYAISKFVGVKAKDVKARLGDPTELMSVPQAKAEIAARMTPMLQKHIRDTEARLQVQTNALMARKKDIVQRQRKERSELGKAQEARRIQETQVRSQRYRKGLRGLWDRVIGNHRKITRQNQTEIQECLKRDQLEKEQVIFCQLDDRRGLHQHIKQVQQIKSEQIMDLHRDIGDYAKMALQKTLSQRNNFEKSFGSEAPSTLDKTGRGTLGRER